MRAPLFLGEPVPNLLFARHFLRLEWIDGKWNSSWIFVGFNSCLRKEKFNSVVMVLLQASYLVGFLTNFG